jgi:glucosamine-6-phosphate deaminase
MRVSPEIFENANEVGAAAAIVIADQIAEAGAAARTFVLGCPSGRSGLATYEHLAAEVSRRHLDLSHVVIALMDEYLVLSDGALLPVSVDESHSCVGFGLRHIVAPLSEAAGPGRGIRPANFWYPGPEDAANFDARLADAGGVDVFLLASGASDGHVALNPVGSAATSTTRIVELGEKTRRDNLSTFPTLVDIAQVPRFGVTVGVGTICSLSKSVIMLAHGADKQEAVRRLEAADRYDPQWPATILSECQSPRFFVDREAGELLDSAA